MSVSATAIGHAPLTMTRPTPPKFRFAEFEVNIAERKLYRNGVEVELQAKGFTLLATLLRHHGNTVSRFDLANELWPGLYVQVDQGLNAAVRKVRRALGDKAYSSKYVQTIGSYGYRFIHPVEIIFHDEERDRERRSAD